MIEYRNLKADLLKSDKILVIRMRKQDGRMYPWHYWVTRDEMEDNDLVLHDPQNSRYYCCKDVEDMKRLFQKNFGEWLDKATPEEKLAIEDYTNKAFSAINAHLRWINGHKPTSTEQITSDGFDKILALDSAIDNFVLPKDITVHRAVDTSWLRDLNKHTHCKIYQDPAFMSTSVLVDPIEEDTERSYVHCIIKVPAGKGRGIYVRPMSVFPTENEFIIRRDTAFLVEGVHRSGSGHWVIQLKVSGLMNHVNPKGGGKMKKSEKPERTQIKPERRDRFTFKSGDGKFFESKEEFEKYCKDNNRTVEWIGD